LTGRRTAILLAALVAAAALVDLGALHRLEYADAIVPVLVSLQRWTPFYWDQERYGMLVPLLAVPVRDPLWNLLLQRFLLALAGLGAVVLLARHVLPGRDGPLAGALAAAGLLAVAPAPWLFQYLFDQPYGLSLALALAGLAVAEPSPAGPRPGEEAPGEDQPRAGGRRPAGRAAAGALLVVAAHWVNAAVGILLLALAVARAGAGRLAGDAGAAERLRRDAVLLAGGLAAGQAIARLASAAPSLRLAMAPLPPRSLPAAWAALFANAWREAGPWPAWLAVAALAGAALLARTSRRDLRGALLRAAALVAAALAYGLCVGSLRWVEENAFPGRYLAPSAILVHLAAASLLAAPLARMRRAAGPAAAAALALLPVAALAAAGPPSLRRVRADLDAAAGGLTADLLAARCEVLAGEYWTVWPAVWHAALVHRERRDGDRLHGLTHRATPTVAAWWDRRDGIRICRRAGEEAAADRWLRDFRLPPMRAVERAGAVEVLAPAR
jgi:hypothetical protein